MTFPRDRTPASRRPTAPARETLGDRLVAAAFGGAIGAAFGAVLNAQAVAWSWQWSFRWFVALLAFGIVSTVLKGVFS